MEFQPIKFDCIEVIHARPVLKKAFPIGEKNGVTRVVGPPRDIVVLHAIFDGVNAYSTIDALPTPIYNNETAIDSYRIALQLAPNLIGRDFRTPEQIVRALGKLDYREHWIGKKKHRKMFEAGFANLYYDAQALALDVPLYTLVGGTRNQVEVGVSLPTSITEDEIRKKIDTDGFRRIKVKVSPKQDDLAKIKAIRRAFPNTMLMVDANSAFDYRNKEHIKILEEYAALDLLMIEQPLADDDIKRHIQLQKHFNVNNLPGYICLDESIHTMDDLTMAVNGGIPIINIKIARVGGLHIAQQMIEYAASRGVKLWIGGMLEPTTSKAHSLAIAAHPGVTLPADISGTDAYFKDGDDFTETPMTRNGAFIAVPLTPGRGFNVSQEILQRVTLYKQIFSETGRIYSYRKK